jgi:hypothetical protein
MILLWVIFDDFIFLFDYLLAKNGHFAVAHLIIQAIFCPIHIDAAFVLG